MRRSRREEYADRMEGGILDDQGQLITDVMAMTGRIAPFELSFLELFFREGSPERVKIKCDGGCIDQECRIHSFPPTCATGIEDAGNDGYELSLITFAEEPVDSVGRCYILNPIKPRNFFRDLISWTTKAISTEKNMATRAILIACSADATGVIPLFESSCLVLRVDTADKTFCKSNHFGSCGSTIRGECIVIPNLYSPSSTINFAVYFRLISYFVQLKSVLLSDLYDLFLDHVNSVIFMPDFGGG